MTGWLSACASSNCVEVRRVGDMVEVRDSNRPDKSIRTPLADWDRFVAGVCAGEFAYLTAEWQTAEPSSEPLTDVDPGRYTETSRYSVTEALRAESGPVVSEHPLVQAVLDVTPRRYDGTVTTAYAPPLCDYDACMEHYDLDGPAEPLARKQTAAVLRSLVKEAWPDMSNHLSVQNAFLALADDIDPKDGSDD